MTHRRTRVGAWHAPRTPAEHAHHAVVRDADPRLFDAVVRCLRQRLYTGSVTRRARAQDVGCAVLHQGAPVWLAPALVLGGGAMLFAIGPYAAQAIRVAVTVAIVAAAAIACTPRKHVWVTAMPLENGERIDLWLAGSGILGGDAFRAEFSRLVGLAETLRDVEHGATTLRAPESIEHMQSV